jgi:hypothetical protein
VLTPQIQSGGGADAGGKEDEELSDCLRLGDLAARDGPVRLVDGVNFSVVIVVDDLSRVE